MNTTEILQKLKQTFNDLVNVQPVAPVQLMEATLKDGTKVEITDMAVGGIVTINGTPAPVGEHELSDGTYIVVGENGAITEIKKEEVAPAMDMTAQFSAMESSFNEKFATLENKIASYETKIEATNKFISELFEFTKTLAEMPTGTPDVAVKTDNQFVEAKKKDYSILFN